MTANRYLIGGVWFLAIAFLGNLLLNVFELRMVGDECKKLSDHEGNPSTPGSNILSIITSPSVSDPHEVPQSFAAEVAALHSKLEQGARCSPEQSAKIASQDPVPKTACPDREAWWRVFIDAQNSARKTEYTLISIGCNKGDDLVQLMREWSRNDTYKVQDMHAATGNLNRACPLRPDMSDTRITDQSSIRSVRGFCVEAMLSNANLLNHAFASLGYFPAVTLLHAAASSTAGTAFFPDAGPGAESFGLGSSTGKVVEVKVTTLDQIVQDHNITSIDVLSIDTEGNDMRVIFGAVYALSSAKIRFLEFEYHGVNRWARSDLQDLIDLLDQFGFDCYWEGGFGWLRTNSDIPQSVDSAGKLWRLTGCWHDSYYNVYSEVRTKGNVACAHRSEKELIQKMHLISSSIGAGWDIGPEIRADSPLVDEKSESTRTGLNPKSFLAFSFLAINTVYGGYSDNPTDFFNPYIKNRICYFQKHNLGFALRLIDWRNQNTRYQSAHYMKPTVVKEIMALKSEWVFFMDADLIIVDFERKITDFLTDNVSIIVNDHNAALNNGAFFLRKSAATEIFLHHWELLTTGKLAPIRQWPFTDNGAFLEALVRSETNHISKCGEAPGPDFLTCYHKLFTELSGRHFDGTTDRYLPGEILLSHSVRGFNNHRCNSEALQSWGWNDAACFHDHESMILHTKVYESVVDDACHMGKAFDSIDIRDGTLMFLPNSTSPCYLDDPSCSAKVDDYMKKGVP